MTGAYVDGTGTGTGVATGTTSGTTAVGVATGTGAVVPADRRRFFAKKRFGVAYSNTYEQVDSRVGMRESQQTD